MPLLLYCITGPSAQLNSSAGAAGSPVLRLEVNGLAIHFSENESTNIWLNAPLRTSAAEFHHVQRELFRSAAILPFRFPTILESEGKLRDHLAERAAEYRSSLDRFATKAQMDILLTHTGKPPQPASGAAYLRNRQSRTNALERFANTLRQQGGPLLKGWRQHSASNALRCFALLEREQVEEFNETIKRIAVPQEISARVSGPWPVAEFLDLKL